ERRSGGLADAENQGLLTNGPDSAEPVVLPKRNAEHHLAAQAELTAHVIGLDELPHVADLRLGGETSSLDDLFVRLLVCREADLDAEQERPGHARGLVVDEHLERPQGDALDGAER